MTACNCSLLILGEMLDPEREVESGLTAIEIVEDRDVGEGHRGTSLCHRNHDPASAIATMDPWWGGAHDGVGVGGTFYFLRELCCGLVSHHCQGGGVLRSGQSRVLGGGGEIPGVMAAAPELWPTSKDLQPGR